MSEMIMLFLVLSPIDRWLHKQLEEYIQILCLQGTNESLLQRYQLHNDMLQAELTERTAEAESASQRLEHLLSARDEREAVLQVHTASLQKTRFWLLVCPCKAPVCLISTWLAASHHGTMKLGSTARVLAKCLLKYYRISKCMAGLLTMPLRKRVSETT